MEYRIGFKRAFRFDIGFCVSTAVLHETLLLSVTNVYCRTDPGNGNFTLIFIYGNYLSLPGPVANVQKMYERPIVVLRKLNLFEGSIRQRKWGWHTELNLLHSFSITS